MGEISKYTKIEPSSSSTAEDLAVRWVSGNLNEYFRSLQDLILALRNKAIKEAAGNGLSIPIAVFDSDLRTPEEMPLCSMWTVWSMSNPIPACFRKVRGSVAIDDEYLDFPSQVVRADHEYLEAVDGSGVIVDHCSAQFYWRRSELVPKGDRLKTVIANGGDLIRSFDMSSDEPFRFLIGRKPIIAERLGLRYDAQPRSGD